MAVAKQIGRSHRNGGGEVREGMDARKVFLSFGISAEF